MTQKELDFIQEACYEKVQRILSEIVNNQVEIQKLMLSSKSKDVSGGSEQVNVEKQEKVKK